jgi:DNA-binding response OmpR family regulator
MSKSEQGTILIVDDMPDNIRTLRAFLQTSDFRVLVATNGEEGVETAQYANPDLILLDILMPGIDGFEACRRLKNSPQCRKTPIIFITALSSLEDKLKAFKVGAVDYISKPFYQEEVLARVNTHLTICQLQKKLQQQNEESIQINREKKRVYRYYRA